MQCNAEVGLFTKPSILGYRNVFLFALAPGVISVFIIFFVNEKNTPAKQQSKEISVKLNLKELPANLKLFIIVSSLPFQYSAVPPTWPVRSIVTAAKSEFSNF